VLLMLGCRQSVTAHAVPSAPRMGFGRAATKDEVALLDIDVLPDGTGLPAGRGSAAQGSAIYRQLCAGCHGASGREGPSDVLVGREPPEGFRLARRGSYAAPITIGNYWPYATTLFDYVRRAMPWQSPGSLTADETYSVVAWLLAQNSIIRQDQWLDKRTLPTIKMPAVDRFFSVRAQR
jgi:hypothetical protein